MTKRFLQLLSLILLAIVTTNLQAQARLAIYGTAGTEKSGLPNDAWKLAGTFGLYVQILQTRPSLYLRRRPRRSLQPDSQRSRWPSPRNQTPSPSHQALRRNSLRRRQLSSNHSRNSILQRLRLPLRPRHRLHHPSPHRLARRRLQLRHQHLRHRNPRRSHHQRPRHPLLTHARTRGSGLCSISKAALSALATESPTAIHNTIS